MAYELKLKSYITQQQHARLIGKVQLNEHTIIPNLAIYDIYDAHH